MLKFWSEVRSARLREMTADIATLGLGRPVGGRRLADL